LTAATGRLALGDGEVEEAERKNKEDTHADAKPAAPATPPAPSSSTSSSSSAHELEEEEEDDEEAFQTFLFDDAPLAYHCPIGICLLTDPITAKDGHTYQRAELERWIETCRVKQQPLTSPMTKEPMYSMISPSHFVRSQVGEYIEQRRQEWVARKGKKKGWK